MEWVNVDLFVELQPAEHRFQAGDPAFDGAAFQPFLKQVLHVVGQQVFIYSAE